MIIATAGHIDHGKTLLVKAITGVETDRLPEEKRRGLTIDLGFAYQDIGQNEILGFVDVPGHERFVRNMLAGVTNIDFPFSSLPPMMASCHKPLNIWKFSIYSVSKMVRWPLQK